MQLRRLKNVETVLDKRVDEKLEPYRAQHEFLKTIPGVNCPVAAVLIAEIGVDMIVFLNAYTSPPWAGGCPGKRIQTDATLLDRREGDRGRLAPSPAMKIARRVQTDDRWSSN